MSPRLFKDAEALSEGAAAHVAELVSSGEGPFHLVLSGGSTPKRLYTILSSDLYRASIPWHRVHFWFGDERFVPPDDPNSNEGMARAAMLDHVPVPYANVHPMFRSGTAEEAAAAYEKEIREVLGDAPFDLVLLGLGPDAHTASLFPGDSSIHEEVRLVMASTGAAGVKQRLTLTPPALCNSREILFLVAGEEKAEPLRSVLHATYDPDRFPAQIVARQASNVVWYLDEQAASDLNS